MATKDSLNGKDLHAMFIVAGTILEHNIQSLNSINVFPVADGDTGTNVLLTVRAATAESDKVKSHSAEKVADALAKGAMIGAKGNSGIILSQFFKGLSLAFHGKSIVTTQELATALSNAKDLAYASVQNPVEGTILTVINKMAAVAEDIIDTKCTLAQFCERICQAAKETVTNTPAMLPILREAGVVDAGSQALYLIVEGIYLYVKDDYANLDKINIKSEPVSAVKVTAEKELGFCTKLILTGENIEIDQLKNELDQHVDSMVVVGDEHLLKIHLHAEEPQFVIDLLSAYGRVSNVQIDNMDVQHSEYLLGNIKQEDVNQALFAIVPDMSFAEILTSLGVTIFLPDSLIDPKILFAHLRDHVAQHIIIFLPSSAVNQLAELIVNINKHVELINYDNVPQIISATAVIDANASFQQNLLNIKNAWKQLRVGSIVKDGQKFVGYFNNKVLTSHDSFKPLLLKLLQAAQVSNNELLTIYYGEDFPPTDLTSLQTILIENNVVTDIEFIGVKGKDIYVLFSLE